MNSLFFACTDCNKFIDAGYRWAYANLVATDIVHEGKPISVAAVISAREYWHPPVENEAAWLRDLLPLVRKFLTVHQEHSIILGDMDDEDLRFDWLDESPHPEMSPRYFVEVLGFTRWDHVYDFVLRADRKPWWWECHWEDLHTSARRSFEQLAEARPDK